MLVVAVAVQAWLLAAAGIAGLLASTAIARLLRTDPERRFANALVRRVLLDEPAAE